MSDRAYIATHKGLFVLQRHAGGLWEVEEAGFLGDPVTAVLPDRRDGSVLAALNLGHFGVKMWRQAPGGPWESCEVPAYPTDAAPEGGSDKAPSLVQVWNLEAGGADEPGVAWAGTMPGGLFLSPDGGRSWDLVRSLWERDERREWFGGGAEHPGIHSVCVDPRDSRHVSVGVSCGGVWITRDGGASWEICGPGMRAVDYMPPQREGEPNVQDVHRLLHAPSRPDTMWVQHHCGIWRSLDAAASWQPVEVRSPAPSAFGFALAVHPDEPDTAWFVPARADNCRLPVDARLVVMRTRDGGRSFQVLDQGLPPGRAYDIVYRHGLDVDESGRRLVMGSTTGALWVSENGGDSWQCLSAHLPPVWCVRFA